VAEVDHFAYGWISPALAYAMAVLGAVLGMGLMARSRLSTGWSRARWLTLAGVGFGATGLWLMQFMALFGFDVPDSVVRLDAGVTAASAGLAVLSMVLGLLVVGFGRPSAWRIVLGGALSGVGIAATHYLGVSALRVGGVVSHHPERVALGVTAAVVAAAVVLWLAASIRGGRATTGAALVIAAAMTSMHYAGMWSVQVQLTEVTGPVPGWRPVALVIPVAVFACLLISALAYAAVGFSVRIENAREEALLAEARALAVAARLRGRVTGRARAITARRSPRR
jgi:NO-binding membrane sensor protein with MHYT domain